MAQGFTNEQPEKVLFTDSPSIDAFGRLRVSNPDYRFDGQLVYQISPDVWDTAFTPSNGTVTYDRTNKMAACQVFGTGSAVMQSHYHCPYTPGRSQMAFMTFAFGTVPGGGATRRAGYWDGTNGAYLEQTSSGINLVLASSTGVGNETVAQANWNLDKFNGTGPSGFTLDLTKIQILYINLQALYSGDVIIGFDINGQIWPAHQFLHANVSSFPYIAQASLPVRYEARAAGTGVTLNPICASVISEGGGETRTIPARTFSVGLGTNSTGASGRRPVLSLRCLKHFNQIINNGIILPASFAAFATGQSAYIELVRNGVLTGASYAAVDSANSMAEVDTAATVITGGSTVFATYAVVTSGVPVPFTDNLLSRLVICYSQLLDQSDVLSIVATSMSGTSQLSVGLTWKEIR